MADGKLVFPDIPLPAEVVANLRRQNPWWEGKPQSPLPKTRRHLVQLIRRRIGYRLAPIVVVRGPRQIGKTTTLLQVTQDLLDEGTPPLNILVVQFDQLPQLELKEPLLRFVDWYERDVLGKTLNQAAHDGEATYLVFDGVQNVPYWAPQLKLLVDRTQTTVLVSGSSALRIEAGRDSLAGRITTLEAGVLSLTEIATFNDLDLGEPFLEDNGLEALRDKAFWRELAAHGRRQAARDEIFAAFSSRGGYPVAHRLRDVPWNVIADQLNETVIRRVIQHDLRSGSEGEERDPLLLEEVFRLACRYAGQMPGLQLFVREVRRALETNVRADVVERHLRSLADSLLLRLVPPLEIRLRRTRGRPKICLADHALRVSWTQEVTPLDPAALAREPDLTVLAGHLAESVLGTTLCSIPGLDVAHLPARNGDPEVDFVLTTGDVRIPLEVKYQRRIRFPRDTEGVRTFIENAAHRAPFGVLVTQTDEATVDDPRLVALPLSSLLLLR